MKKVQDLTGRDLFDELGVEIEEEEVSGYPFAIPKLHAHALSLSLAWCAPEEKTSK